MWIVQWIFVALVILVVLGFALYNQQMVTVTVINWESPQLPLYIVCYIAFGAGLLTWFLVSLFRVFQLKAQIRNLNRDNRNLKEELDKLRNISIEEEVEVEESPE